MYELLFGVLCPTRSNIPRPMDPRYFLQVTCLAYFGKLSSKWSTSQSIWKQSCFRLSPSANLMKHFEKVELIWFKSYHPRLCSSGFQNSHLVLLHLRFGHWESKHLHLRGRRSGKQPSFEVSFYNLLQRLIAWRTSAWFLFTENLHVNYLHYLRSLDPSMLPFQIRWHDYAPHLRKGRTV